MFTNFVSQKLLKICPSTFMILQFGKLSKVTAKFDKICFNMTLLICIYQCLRHDPFNLHLSSKVKNNPTAYQLPYLTFLLTITMEFNSIKTVTEV